MPASSARRLTVVLCAAEVLTMLGFSVFAVLLAPLRDLWGLSNAQAGLVGGGAVDSGHMAIILGNSAVVNSSSTKRPQSGNLDVMRLNWGPYLWMRCYNNGAQFIDQIVGARPDWKKLEAAATTVPPSAGLSIRSCPSIAATRSPRP